MQRTNSSHHNLKPQLLQKRLCNFKKKNWAMKTLEEAANNDIWRFPNWSKGTRVYLTPPISHGPNRPKAITHKEKCEAIWEELYQPPPALDHDFNPDTSTRRNDDLPFRDVLPKKSKKPYSRTTPTLPLATLKSPTRSSNGCGTTSLVKNTSLL